MRRLIEHRAAALRRVEFLRAARAAQEVRVVERVDHAHRAVRAARDQFARAQDRRIERMAVPDDQMHARRRAAAAIIAAQSSSVSAIGFSTSTCLPCRAASDGMLRVKLMRRRDIDDLDIRVGAKLPRRCHRSSAGKVGREARRAPRAADRPPRPASTRGSATKVGSMTVNARPSPATPMRSFRPSLTRRSSSTALQLQ